jgi:hypothetical protein
MKFYRNQQIEDQAGRRLDELEQVLGRPLAPPVPIDVLAERVLGLDFLWEAITELPGEVILGGIQPAKRLIVLNENRRALFDAKPGLERSTKGHEMGHWDLFVDRARLDHPTLFEAEAEGDGNRMTVLRSSPVGDVEVMKLLLRDPEGRELLRKMEAHADRPDEARSVNRYAAALSLPPRLLRPAVLAIDRSDWRNLYPIADQFNVTISALKVRLEQLGLLYLRRDGTLYEFRDAGTGQGTFDF